MGSIKDDAGGYAIDYVAASVGLYSMATLEKQLLNMMGNLL